MIHPQNKRRRTRRLALIGGVLVLIVLVIGGRYLMVAGRSSSPAEDPRREAGLTAFAAGNYEQAIAELRPYADTNDRDAEALYALANAQRRTTAADGSHLLDAVTSYRMLLRTEPGHAAATAELLSIFMQYPQGVEGEALKLADRLLKIDPTDPTALRSKAICLARIGQPDAALEAVEAYLAQVPKDVQMQRVALDVLKRQSIPPAALLQRTAALREAYPNDPRFELVEAYARLLTDDPQAAQPFIDLAASRPPTDRDFILQLVQIMDAANRFPQVLTYLEQAVGPESDPALKWELVRRRFEIGQLEEALALLESFQGRDRTLPMQILQVIALHRLGQSAAAATALSTVESSYGSHGEAAARVLKLSLLQSAPPPQILEAARNLAALNISDPYLDALVAQAYAAAGQTDQAIAAYENARTQRNAWAGPCLGLAKLLLDRGEYARATAYAVGATQRQPESIFGYILTALAAGAQPASLDNEKTADLLSLIDRVQQAQPGEPRTLVLRIAVLAERGRKDEAAAAARAAAELDPPLSEEALVQLSDVARRYSLGLDERLQQLYVDRYGQTPQIAMVRALSLAESGDVPAALAAYDQAAPARAGAEWAINRALLLERLTQPEAVAAWQLVAEEYPSDEQVQRRVLRSAAAWTDRELVDQTITRLSKLAGPDDPTWRTERARWLLSGSDDNRAAQADAMLAAALDAAPQDTAALTLRATSLRMLDKPGEASALLEKAVNQNPDAVGLRLELASLQLQMGDRNAAAASVQQALAFTPLRPEFVRGAADLLIRLDQPGQATAQLELLLKRDEATARDRLTLAELYRQADRQDEALAQLDAVLAEPTAIGVAFAADLYARAGQPEQAQQTLDLLATLPDLPAAEAAAIRARFAAAHGSQEQAETAFQSAVTANPSDPQAWRNLVSYRLRTGRIREAIASARSASESVPNDAGLRSLRENAPLIDRLADQTSLTWLWLAMLEQPQDQSAAIEAAQAIDQARAAGKSFVQQVDKLVTLADANPDFEGLQILAVYALQGASRTEAATTRASAALNRFASSPRSAQLAAEAWAAAGRWSEALLAAEAWADRTPGIADDRIEAHLLAALAHRELGRPDAAVNLLETHRDRINNQPRSQPQLTRAYALALAAAQKPTQARQILEPLLSESSFWRMTWLDVVVQSVAQTATAREWLSTVASLIPGEGPAAAAEKLALAQAYWAVGVRDSFPSFMDEARRLSIELTTRDDATAEVFFFLGTMAETTGNLAEAEANYRQALSMDDAAATVRNNLAMVLSADDARLDEAVALARQAVAQQPLEANFQDTLAHVLLQQDDFAGAEQAIRRAIELDPGNSLWQRRLSEIQTQRSAAVQ